MLMGDACSRPLITIRSHNLYACDIRRVLGEITSYTMRGISSLPFFWFLQVVRLLAFPFCLPCNGSSHQSFYWIFVGCDPLY